MKSDRITIRLPNAQVSNIDALVDLGEYSTRTEVIRAALRLFFQQEGTQANQKIEAEKGMLELQKMAAEKERLRKQLEGLLDQL